MRIGVDLGGTKIEVIALDDRGKTLARDRLPTPRHDYDATIATIKELVQATERKLNQSNASVGIGTPGALSPKTGRIKNSNSTWLINKPLDRDLETALMRKVRFANDADCFTLSEATDGAAHGASIVFGVILGTGVGGGIVANGRVLCGPNAITGEWGHNPLPWPTTEELPGPKCYCGKNGCLESFLSGPSASKAYEAKFGGHKTMEEIVKKAQGGSANELKLLEQYEDRLARGLASVINVIDPEVIVVGGGLSNISRLYESVPKIWGKYVFSDQVDTQIVPAKFGDSSGVRGAAWLWPVQAGRSLT